MVGQVGQVGQRGKILRESELEKRLVAAVRSTGGMCLKWSSPGTAGVPDRICLMPDGRVLFVEVKTPTGRLSPVQVAVHRRMSAIGHSVAVVRSAEEINELLEIVDEV